MPTYEGNFNKNGSKGKGERQDETVVPFRRTTAAAYASAAIVGTTWCLGASAACYSIFRGNVLENAFRDPILNDFTFVKKQPTSPVTTDKTILTNAIGELVTLANDRSAFLATVREEKASSGSEIAPEIIEIHEKQKQQFLKIAAKIMPGAKLPTDGVVSDTQFQSTFEQLRIALANNNYFLLAGRYEIQSPPASPNLSLNFRVFALKSANYETHKVWEEDSTALVVTLGKEQTSFKAGQDSDSSALSGGFSGRYEHGETGAILIVDDTQPATPPSSSKNNASDNTSTHEFGHKYDYKHNHPDSPSLNRDPFQLGVTIEAFAQATEFRDAPKIDGFLQSVQQSLQNRNNLEKHSVAYLRIGNILVQELAKSPDAYGIKVTSGQSTEDEVIKNLPSATISKDERIRIADLMKNAILHDRENLEGSLWNKLFQQGNMILVLLGLGLVTPAIIGSVRSELRKAKSWGQFGKALRDAVTSPKELGDIAKNLYLEDKNDDPENAPRVIALRKLYQMELAETIGSERFSKLHTIVNDFLESDPVLTMHVKLPILAQHPQFANTILPGIVENMNQRNRILDHSNRFLTFLTELNTDIAHDYSLHSGSTIPSSLQQRGHLWLELERCAQGVMILRNDRLTESK